MSTSLEHGWGDPDPYRAVITTGDGTGDLAPLLAAVLPRRRGTGLNGCARPRIDRLRVGPRWAAVCAGPRARPPAAGLTREEAKACAAIVDLTRESEPIKVPPFEQAADDWRAFADQAGALREELTHVREEGPAGDGSLLPGAAEEYVEAAATTVEDVGTLAPVVPEQVRRTVEEADPTLDEDVADWFDAEVERPPADPARPGERSLRRGQTRHPEAQAVLRRDPRLPRLAPQGRDQPARSPTLSASQRQGRGRTSARCATGSAPIPGQRLPTCQLPTSRRPISSPA